MLRCSVILLGSLESRWLTSPLLSQGLSELFCRAWEPGGIGEREGHDSGGAGSRGFRSSPKRPSLLQKTNEPTGNLSQISAQPVTANRPPALCSHTALCLYPSCPDTTHPTHCWLTQPSTCLPFPFPSQSCPTPPTHTHIHTLVLAREPSFLSLGTYFSKGGSHHHCLIPLTLNLQAWPGSL